MGNLLKILGHNCMDQNTNFSDEIFLDFDNVGKAQNSLVSLLGPVSWGMFSIRFFEISLRLADFQRAVI